MMLVLLLIGVSASMVLLAFPSARTQEATQILARFQAQLALSASAGSKPASSLAPHPPDRWQFMACSPRKQRRPGGGDDRNGYRWLPLRAGRVATSEPRREQADARFPHGEAWTPGEQPDVLIFPGGEVTPFQLRIGERRASTSTPGDSQPLAAQEQP
jgi:general secretion pathway protein H